MRVESLQHSLLGSQVLMEWKSVENHPEEADVWMSLNLSLACLRYPVHLGRACLSAGTLHAINAVDISTIEHR